MNEPVYTVLSPWAEVDNSEAQGLTPRLDSLEGKTIGMLSHFKGHSPVVLHEVARQLQLRYPNTNFSFFQYPRDTKEIPDDAEFDPIFREWVASVDGIISALGDMGSCALFLAYNTVYAEKLGKPTVMLCDRFFINSAKRGAAARLVPMMRTVASGLKDMSFEPKLDKKLIDNVITPEVEKIVDELVDGLTKPLTAEEMASYPKDNAQANQTFTGTLQQINDIFYGNGWTNGTPITPPTAEAVAALVECSGMKPDKLIAKIPPMRGKATVEKIAVNAAMAGCSPLYMPVVIAAVRGMMDPCVHLEGYTCSRASWAPLAIINGPVRNDLDIDSGSAVLSHYKRANAAIARTIGYIVMNIGGVRPNMEDMSGNGHVGRLGMCIAENEEESPWGPLSEKFGFLSGDNTITMFWPSEQYTVMGHEPDHFLKQMCRSVSNNFAPGCCYVIGKDYAQAMADAGMTKKSIGDYLVEYTRVPAATLPVRWYTANNHNPGVPMPKFPDDMTRGFWSDEHIIFVVAGVGVMQGLLGGGDHGGPSCTKIELPENWDALVRKYGVIKPEYAVY